MQIRDKTKALKNYITSSVKWLFDQMIFQKNGQL